MIYTLEFLRIMGLPYTQNVNLKNWFSIFDVYDEEDKKRIKQGLENSKKINLEQGEFILPWYSF